MKIGICSDHGGYALKEIVQAALLKEEYTVVDYGSFILDLQDDYPDFVFPLAKAVAAGEVEKGIAICGSGVGAAIAANKIKGVRAALIQDYFAAHQGVEDDDMNLICLGGRITGDSSALDLVTAFLNARFSGADRHVRRLQKIKNVEEGNQPA